MSFDKAYQITSKHEGGYANVPGDRGGETYKGIARKFHPAWPGWVKIDDFKAKNGPIRRNAYIPVAGLDQLVKDFYYEKFFLEYGIHQLSSPELACLVYDSCVHSGSNGIIFLQKAANQLGAVLAFDGILGPLSLAAINNLSAAALHDGVKKLRMEYLKNLSKRPGQSQFWAGWHRRVSSFPDLTVA